MIVMDVRADNFQNNLKRHGFDIHRFWSESASGEYRQIKNDAGKIKTGPQKE